MAQGIIFGLYRESKADVPAVSVQTVPVAQNRAQAENEK